jgi:hypothetical protein
LAGHAQKVLGTVDDARDAFRARIDVDRASARRRIAAGCTLSCRVCCVYGRKAVPGVFVRGLVERCLDHVDEVHSVLPDSPNTFNRTIPSHLLCLLTLSTSPSSFASAVL